MYPSIFEALVDSFRKLPGVGLKTAERYAFDYLKWNQEEAERLIIALQEAKTSIRECGCCHNLAESDMCDICKDEGRDHSTILVVEQIQDLIAMEKTREYKGVYHVLGGTISASKGIMPNDLNIDSLVERCNNQINEVILATNPTVEGETTALYLSKLLEGKDCTITRIAHGIPMGGHLDYADELTLIKAFENRRKVE